MRGWLANRINRQHERRKTLKRCDRCHSLYDMHLDGCPYCSGLSDLEVQRQLDKRASFRIDLGRLMLLASLIIIIVMIIEI